MQNGKQKNLHKRGEEHMNQSERPELTLRTAPGKMLSINFETASKSGVSPPTRSVTVYPSPYLAQ